MFNNKLRMNFSLNPLVLSLFFSISYTLETCPIGPTLYAGASTDILSPTGNESCSEIDILFQDLDIHTQISVSSSDIGCDGYLLQRFFLPAAITPGWTKVTWLCDEEYQDPCQQMSIAKAPSPTNSDMKAVTQACVPDPFITHSIPTTNSISSVGSGSSVGTVSSVGIGSSSGTGSSEGTDLSTSPGLALRATSTTSFENTWTSPTTFTSSYLTIASGSKVSESTLIVLVSTTTSNTINHDIKSMDSASDRVITPTSSMEIISATSKCTCEG